ncbi:hypothetical protein RB614_29850 [Phytohabitans sp. ZYX-F-186]|uniref:Uncharacterized protein n=1 Tax=Phytohabitans maris TaxID=3071409 RepID=A0ABU0ZNY1_9ACTN|nr:hypothetical protein [Phytohabitans sp. ZYX-F-186]MDQ7908743.1 hypothetical protein [Phytohabitans sp. ZYX-F-186]
MDINVIETGTFVVAAWLFWGAMFRGDAVQPAGLVLALVTGGLLWESYDPWMPPDMRPALLKSAATVVAFATIATVTSVRSADRLRAAVAFAGAAGVTGVVLRSDVGQYRPMMIQCAMVLAVVAAGVGAHIPLVRHVLRREEREVAAAVHRLWLTGMVWAVLVTVGLGALWLQPMPSWAAGLVATATAALANTVVTIGQTIALMWRHRGFAAAYATEMSQTRIGVRSAMVGSFLLVFMGAAVPWIAHAAGGNPEWVTAMTWFAAGYVALVMSNAMRLVRREALRQRRNTMTAPASAAVRNLALDDPVYRLLPGVAEKRD